ncbi:MAG: citrate/2-methylcitrate synthase [Candidatus Methanomethylophilaceae archaeon]|nr:citrate/2-methylcitrate synthase [Candidatus Methanomethylophilaceae archaeon]
MTEDFNQFIEEHSKICEKNDLIPTELYTKYDVKKGLRDSNGKGVLTGLTNISRVDGFVNIDGVRTPCEGCLWYRGYDVYKLVDGLKQNRFGFEEAAYLLLFGNLPTEKELQNFREELSLKRTLPITFIRDVILKAHSRDIMNSMTKSVLTLAAYDSNMSDCSISNVLRQCIELISVFPMLAVYGYHAYSYYDCNNSLIIHRPDSNLSVSENILRLLRPDGQFTELEAKVLDIALILHMEHGGGNNSTFTTRVVTSTGSDTYSVIAAALSSLKGPKHGGANIKVVQMIKDIKQNVKNLDDDEELRSYLIKILDKQAFDNAGLIYGMGHAVYSISDPRAKIFQGYAELLAKEKGRMKDYDLYRRIEEMAPALICERKHAFTGVSANIDFYSGFVYNMLGIPEELYTPLFAMARVVGWSAHRIEELVNSGKIIRPAYQSVMSERQYLPIEKRE